MSKPADKTAMVEAFRQEFYGCLDRRADALFELTDAILDAGAVPSPAHLSLSAVHRRGNRYVLLETAPATGIRPLRFSSKDRELVYAAFVCEIGCIQGR